MSAFDPPSVFFPQAERGFLDSIRERIKKRRFPQVRSEPLIEILTTVH